MYTCAYKSHLTLMCEIYLKCYFFVIFEDLISALENNFRIPVQKECLHT